MVNSRDKGKRYERHVAGLFRAEGYEARRGQQYSGIGGDDVVGVPGIHIECKAVERLNIYDAIDQSRRDAKGALPIVIHKKNNCDDLVTMRFIDWIQLYREYELNRKVDE